MSARTRRSAEAHVAGLRAWLESNPSPATPEIYDVWSGRADAGARPRAVSSTAILNGLALSWSWTLRVAEGEYELDEARRRYLDELTRQSGPFRLIGVGGIALVYQTSREGANQETRVAGFPPPVAIIGGTRAWYRRDVERHRRGQRVRRAAGELQRSILDTEEVADRFGLTPRRLLSELNRRAGTMPQPLGSVSGKRYWLRREVETPASASTGLRHDRHA